MLTTCKILNGNTKQGFTLIELMVYIALLGGIVLIAGQAFSDSTKMRIRTQSMLQSNQNAGNVGSILQEDIAQLGAKSSQEENAIATKDTFYIDAMGDVFMDPNNADATKKDSSSYYIGNNDELDTLKFKKIRYDQDGHYVAVEEITWYVDEDDGTLKRICQTIAGTEEEACKSNDPDVVTMAAGVQKFNITAAEPGIKESLSRILPSADTSVHGFRLIPRYGDYNLAFTNVDPVGGGTTVSLSGFASNYDFENQEPITDGKNANQVFYADLINLDGNWKERCHSLTFETNTEYEISFTMPYSSDASRLFCPGRDYMSVGFRRINDGTRPSDLKDFTFYPPTNTGAAEGKRRFRFRTKNKIENVCMAFTFASYSPVVANGKISFSEIILKRVESANYTFSGNAIDITEKKHVKALRLELSIAIHGENGVLSLVIPIPSNGTQD